MKVKELLSSKDKWTQYKLARTANGYPTCPTYNDAVSFCLMGAIEKCYNSAPIRIIVMRRLAAAINSTGNHDIISVFNDDPRRTFEEIQSVINLADI